MIVIASALVRGGTPLREQVMAVASLVLFLGCGTCPDYGSTRYFTSNTYQITKVEDDGGLLGDLTVTGMEAEGTQVRVFYEYPDGRTGTVTYEMVTTGD